ncbi:hypothetical protein [Deefgea sp. CFH1-16]|uniref:hypothetical protein n=1 Tax=Deefgea sp. CFH1-16 TaxID=2675457 RepID=UPI0015F4E6A4|nr:hypothetical protein [Deefgea sp. CFH1-16]
MLNEASDAAFHLIDFANNNSAIQTAALAREIAAKSPEQEVIIDANARALCAAPAVSSSGA